MALFTYFFGLSRPSLAFASFFLWIFVFSISVGLAGISYSDITAKTMLAPKRTNLYVVKQFFGSIAAFLGGIAVSKIFSHNNLSYPINYSLSLLIGFVGLLISSLGFLIIDEPKSVQTIDDKGSFHDHLKKVPKIIKADHTFKRYVIVENMASFGIMILPFYIIFAKEIFNIDNSYFGRYLFVQVAVTILSTHIWWFLAKKINAKGIVRICIGIGGIIPLVAIGFTFLGPDYFAIIFLLLGFVISGRRVGFEPYLLYIIPEENRTEYLGIRGTLNVFIVVLPILGGSFSDLRTFIDESKLY